MIGASVVDEEREFLGLRLLAARLQPPPLGRHECGLAVFRIELTVGEEPFGPDQFSVLDACRRFLDAIRSRGSQRLVSDELAALRVEMVPIHERIFFGLPVKAFEFVSKIAFTHFTEHALHMVGYSSGD